MYVAKNYFQKWLLPLGILLVAFSMQASAALPATDASGEPLPSLAPMVKKVSPAVVNIATYSTVRVHNPLLEDPFFRRFFNVPGNQQGDQEEHTTSAGSGVIVNADKGYILTNNHVVKGADKITVTLKDGRTFDAKLVGKDPEVDLAVLKIKADHLTQLAIADSSSLQVGDFVVAIGNPFALGQTVTSGIVSALGRTGLGIEGYEDFIQTDASINPGNSGGALVNLKGQLVGINTAILSPAGGNVGIGFAIPTDMAVNVMHQLIKFGAVHRGVLGVTIQNLTPDLAKAFDIKKTRGVLITQVSKDSAAHDAGLKAGDVVLAVDGQPVRRVADLRNKVGLSPVGEKIHLQIVRDGKDKTVTATIREGSGNDVSDGGVLSKYLEGAKLRNLEKGQLSYADQGVLVESVKGDSAAAQAGLQSGDVIISANRKPVTDVNSLRAAVPKNSNTLLLRINRKGGIFFLVIR